MLLYFKTCALQGILCLQVLCLQVLWGGIDGVRHGGSVSRLEVAAFSLRLRQMGWVWCCTGNNSNLQWGPCARNASPLKLSTRRQGDSSKEVLSAVTTKEPIVAEEERWRENSRVEEESGGPQQEQGPQPHEIIYERKGQL